MSLAKSTPRSTVPAPDAPPPTLAAAAERLDSVLRQLVVEHEELLKIAGLHRSAIAHADARLMSECLNAQAIAAARIGELEKLRQSAVAQFTGTIRSMGTIAPAPVSGRGPTTLNTSGPRVTIAQLAKLLSDPMRTRLLSAADLLRDVLNRLHREHAAIKSAAESLSAHMEGLMRQVCRGLSHAGTYARTGNVDASVTVTTALDIRS